MNAAAPVHRVTPGRRPCRTGAPPRSGHRRRAAGQLAALLALVLVLGGCGTTGSDSAGVAEPAPPGVAQEHAGDAAVDSDAAAGSGPQSVTDSAGGLPEGPLVPDTAGRDVVVSGSATLEAADPVATAGEVAGLASSLQGRVDARSTSTYQGRPWASVTVRVPPAQLDAFLQRLGDLGEVTATDLTAQDVTVQVADLQARIDSLTASIARLEELMARAENVTDLVAVETQLAARQAELEGLQAQLRALQDVTSLSTVYLTIRQPGDDGSFSPGLWDRIVEVLTNSARAIVLVLAAVLPWLLPAALLVLAVRRWLRRRSGDPRPTARRRAARDEPRPRGGPAPGSEPPPAGDAGPSPGAPDRPLPTDPDDVRP